MENTKPVYFIFDVKIHDVEGIKPYLEKVEATYKPYGGKRLIAAGALEVVEGGAPQGIIAMLQFDSKEQAHAWHDSEAYQAIVHYRLQSATTTAWLVEGVIPELQ